MKPAASIILFTTIAGAAQGAAVVLAVASLLGGAPAAMPAMLWALAAMLVAALVASFFHLGHPLRAWRAVLMWRTSWMSREVIVLPAFIALVVAWALAGGALPPEHPALPILAGLVIVLALVLWYCTAMIYACIRFIQEWAHPLTIVNYVTLGLASGLVSCGALAVLLGAGDFAQRLGGWTLAAIVLAWFTRILSLRRNARLKPKSTVQSATGIAAPRVVQKAMGMTGGSFNTREFFHGRTLAFLKRMKMLFVLFGFVVPAALILVAMITGQGAWLLLAVPVQYLGLLAERWFFFAQARHPQNLYYQVVS